MSNSRTIRREIRRKMIKDAVANKRIGCPKCGAALWRRSIIGKKVLCTKCAWEGRLR